MSQSPLRKSAVKSLHAKAGLGKGEPEDGFPHRRQALSSVPLPQEGLVFPKAKLLVLVAHFLPNGP